MNLWGGCLHGSLRWSWGLLLFWASTHFRYKRFTEPKRTFKLQPWNWIKNFQSTFQFCPPILMGGPIKSYETMSHEKRYNNRILPFLATMTVSYENSYIHCKTLSPLQKTTFLCSPVVVVVVVPEPLHKHWSSFSPQAPVFDASPLKQRSSLSST